jgi:hypothetical protein
MANLLNSAFNSVFTREDTTTVPEPAHRRHASELGTVRFKVKEVMTKIKQLRADVAAGPDGIGPRILQELVGGLTPALVTIYRRSMEESQVPAAWREANVKPIFKKGVKSSPSNYRPVSLTSVYCKVMEEVVRDEVTHHLQVNKLTNASQHGFVKGTSRSCVTNLIEFLEKATAAIDRGDAFDVVYLDLAKAFDKVPHERLLKKLRAHGINGDLLRWVRSWLMNRRQRVILNRKFSTWADILSGVPQGSILGPLLFIIFINDIDEAVMQVEIIKKFTDDTKVSQIVASSEDREKLQAALDALCGWADRWGIEFNVPKCKIVHMGNNNPKYQYNMGRQPLAMTMEERDIGVTITSNLKPTAQCKKAAKTAQMVLGQIGQSFHFKDRHVFVKLYKQYARPHLEFSTWAWSPWTVSEIECLEKVQQRAVNMVSGLAGTSYEEKLQDAGLLSLEERRHQADMHLMHKIMHRDGGLEANAWFERASSAAHTTMSGADPFNVKVKSGCLEVRRNFYSMRVITDWNRIPTETKSRPGTSHFKAEYRRIRAGTVHPAQHGER